MSYRENLSVMNIAISISESSDMAALGLSDEHLRDAMTEVARHLLALGSRLVYGGDLRQQGFTELLFELVARHRRDADEYDNNPSVTDYLAWPVHISQPATYIERLAFSLEGSARLVLLTLDGRQLGLETRTKLSESQPSGPQWAEGLTAMRKVMLSETQARIVLGGRTEGYKGALPGIAEEALLSLKARQPLFLIGGFGGCTRDIADLLGLSQANNTRAPIWKNHEALASFSATDLRNGLDLQENMTLATTPHIDQAVTLILRGLIRMSDAGQFRPKGK